jgi:hypothetical protein
MGTQSIGRGYLGKGKVGGNTITEELMIIIVIINPSTHNTSTEGSEEIRKIVSDNAQALANGFR